jgi:hypothetical protein
LAIAAFASSVAFFTAGSSGALLATTSLISPFRMSRAGAYLLALS